jgi:hypothetical protein
VDIGSEKIYPISDIWNDIFSFTQSEMRVSENISFTNVQKPENLLRRIIQASSLQGSYILDFFAGSGTTAVVAHKLNRKYIGIESGMHFNEFYASQDGEKRLGLLGRMKIMLKGDKSFKAVDKDRRAHLSKDINWDGGGFFKYYKLEQYEDTLRRMKYSETTPGGFYSGGKDAFENYIFKADQKCAGILNLKDEKASINFNKLYNDIDFAETISNSIGLPIKRITEKTVVINQ